jgi:serine/threonine protein kinase
MIGPPDRPIVSFDDSGETPRPAIMRKELNHPLVEGFHKDSPAVAELESLAKSATPARLRGKTSVAKIAVGIALAMRYLHSQRVVHCNLTPETILVNWDWNVTVGNFAHSLVSGADPQGHPWQSIQSRYLAPECYDDRFTFASDVFSYGMILYRLIVGCPPFPAHLNRIALAKRIVIDEARPEIPESVLPMVRELIIDCWANDPDDRPSFHEILLRLEEMHFRLADGVKSSKVASFVRTITHWEEASQNDER